MPNSPQCAPGGSRIMRVGKFAGSLAIIAALVGACAHGIESELDLTGEDAGPGSGQTTGPTSGTGGSAVGPSASSATGSGGRGDATGVGGSSGSGGGADSSATTTTSGSAGS